MLPMGMSHDITCLTCRGVAIPSWDVNFLRGHATFGEDGLLYEVKWVEERTQKPTEDDQNVWSAGSGKFLTLFQ